MTPSVEIVLHHASCPGQPGAGDDGGGRPGHALLPYYAREGIVSAIHDRRDDLVRGEAHRPGEYLREAQTDDESQQHEDRQTLAPDVGLVLRYALVVALHALDLKSQ